MRACKANGVKVGLRFTITEDNANSGWTSTGFSSNGWLDDTHLVPAGRLDLAVQVGGVNVSPQAVRQHFLGLPEIALHLGALAPWQ